MLGGISCSLGDWCEVLFVSCPGVFVEAGPAVVAGGANALEAGVVTALVNCTPL